MNEVQKKIRKLISSNGETVYRMSLALGESRQNTYQTFRTSDIKADRALEILRSLGYEIELKEIGYRLVDPMYIEYICENRCNKKVHIPGDLYVSVSTNEALDNRSGEKNYIAFNSRKQLNDWVKQAVGKRR